MATLTEIKNQVHTIENISEEVFKYEMEISHLHENSEYYIIRYYKIYTKKGYNYILKNRDGNFYWATPGAKEFIESEHCPEFEIKTYEYHKFIDEQGYTYLDEYKKPILELEADFKKVEGYKDYKENTKQVYKNKVVDDYYISRYIYGLKFTTSVIDYDKNSDLATEQKDDKPKEQLTTKCDKSEFEDYKYWVSKLKDQLNDFKDIKNKLSDFNKDSLKKLTEINEMLDK